MKPRSLMFTLFGDYIQYYGGEIWIGSLIRLMDVFGISEQSVRGATFRMVNQDLLQVRRVGNRSYYSLTAKGKRNVIDGVKRVYSINNHKWDRLWRVLTYSIPEQRRELRTQFRKELSWLGFGLISNSMWVSPNPLEDKVMKLIETHGLEPYVFFFKTDSVMTHDDDEIISLGWDLDEISDKYDQFIQYYEKAHESLRERVWNQAVDPRECFRIRTSIVHEYRKFLFLDPHLPHDLRPDRWNGTRARQLFWNIHQLVSVGAVHFFEECFEHAPDGTTLSNREKAINPFVDANVSFV
ncbi:MAG: phenylacetic acid degradation operon negative regulatory protein PaaX [Firmicutes bacterium]|uniref:Transcriptional regulator, PaaX family n=1 Tax=Melghirimyces thermohalophilus TaxID=1236220 RepID=A0A1G6L8V1_9BACL|nr:PaaX family transcriptional regulator C-terminal domain-containing protein [Melghirimyces thermohalophilus]MDA8353745.1 phenylacetic acid degradation operon negative regulatory protein PaaX [Bacillota bacterium]SDC39215.1 transcriptional regulator, PaaX family [Melghirimyces thermohalophilus]